MKYGKFRCNSKLDMEGIYLLLETIKEVADKEQEVVKAFNILYAGVKGAMHLMDPMMLGQKDIKDMEKEIRAAAKYSARIL